MGELRLRGTLMPHRDGIFVIHMKRMSLGLLLNLVCDRG